MTWAPPSELPDLRRVDRLAIDTETDDVGLQEGRGSSWPWHAGHVCGISIAYRREGDVSSYFPIQHPDTACFDRATVYRWLGDHIKAGVKFTTLNGIYDFGWIGAEGGPPMPPSDRLDEVGLWPSPSTKTTAPIRSKRFARDFGLPGKDETVLREAILAAGLVPKRQRKKAFDCRPYIWQMPARFVGPYAEQDAVATFMGFEAL